MQEMWVWFLGGEYPLEKELATHSSILAWRIPWTKEPGRLQPVGSQRIRQDWRDLACVGFNKIVAPLSSWAFLVVQLVKNPSAIWETWVWSLGWKILWRRERLPTPVFWPGEFHGLYNPWGRKKSDATQRLSLSLSLWQLRKGGKREGFPGGASGKEPACQCRRYKRHGFDPWISKIPWRRTWQPTPVFLPGECHGQKSLEG